MQRDAKWWIYKTATTTLPFQNRLHSPALLVYISPLPTKPWGALQSTCIPFISRVNQNISLLNILVWYLHSWFSCGSFQNSFESCFTNSSIPCSHGSYIIIPLVKPAAILTSSLDPAHPYWFQSQVVVVWAWWSRTEMKLNDPNRSVTVCHSMS